AEAARLLSSSSGRRYEIGRTVGKGGFGQVHKGWQVTVRKNGETVRGKVVAIKQYRTLADAITEDGINKAVTGLRHLPRALDDGFDRATGKNFLVSGWVEGRTLDRWIQ